MPRKIIYFKPPNMLSASKLYEAQGSRREDRNFYSSARWVKFRKVFLSEHPLCTKCNRELATIVHHIIPRKTDEDLAFEESNCAPRCQACHNAESVR